MRCQNGKLLRTHSLALLGLSTTNRAALTRYRKGEPLASNRDLVERVGILMGIHRSLRLLFPHNRELAYSWMTQRNRAFDGMTPAEMGICRAANGSGLSGSGAKPII